MTGEDPSEDEPTLLEIKGIKDPDDSKPSDIDDLDLDELLDDLDEPDDLESYDGSDDDLDELLESLDELPRPPIKHRCNDVLEPNKSKKLSDEESWFRKTEDK